MMEGRDYGSSNDHIHQAWDKFIYRLVHMQNQLNHGDFVDIAFACLDLPGFNSHIQEIFYRQFGFHPMMITAEEREDFAEFRKYELIRIERREDWPCEGMTDFFYGSFPIQRLPFPVGGPCVYLIFNDDNEIIYIGQSQNVESRLKNHQSTKREHNLRSWIIMRMESAEAMMREEAELIYRIRPPLNVEGNPDRDPNLRGY